MGFFGALGIAFIVLKLVGVIDWAWWAVLAPLWIGAVVYAVVFALGWFSR